MTESTLEVTPPTPEKKTRFNRNFVVGAAVGLTAAVAALLLKDRLKNVLPDVEVTNNPLDAVLPSSD